MFRPNWKSSLIVAVVAATLVASASQADACWGCYRPVCSGCYTPCYTVSYSPCCYTGCGGWYVGYRPGPIRRALFGPYRWYYAGGCCWSSCCWDTCSWDLCCTDVTTSATPTPAEKAVPTPAEKAAEEAPAAEPAEVPAAEPAIEPGTSAVPSRENSGVLTIYVPYDAKVTINGLLTHSKGSRRQYVSYGLKPGLGYKYEIHAEVVRDGQAIDEVRTAVVTAGDRTAVAFGFNADLAGGLASR